MGVRMRGTKLKFCFTNFLVEKRSSLIMKITANENDINDILQTFR